MIKKILIGIGVLLVVLIIIGFVLPAKLDVSQSAVIDAPASYIFEEVNDLKKWKQWSYWEYQDTTIKTTYGENTVGVSGNSSWTSADGPGSMVITESTPDKSIKFDLSFGEDSSPAKGWYTFEPDGEGTKVTVGFTAEHGMNPAMRLIGKLLIEPEMKKSFDYQFGKLKEIAESKPKFTVPISEENVSAISYIGISTTMSPQDPAAISAQMAKSFGELMTVLSKAKVETQGAPFCLYPSFSETSMEMVCALPVPENAKLPAKYPIKKTAGGTTIKAVHKGDYAKLMDTHIQLEQYLKYKKLEMTGAPWETYVTDPFVVKDTAQWLTEIFYPVKK